MFSEEIEKKFDELFEKLVPASGAAESYVGELVRACAKISYRYYNDGDRINVGYGRKTCNPAARFLQKYGNAEVASYICDLWGREEDRSYEKVLGLLVEAVIEQASDEALQKEKSPCDMWDMKNDDEDEDWDEEEDDEEDW